MFFSNYAYSTPNINTSFFISADLMDSGQVSQEELTEIRNQFKQMYGSDIGELIKQADKESGTSMGAEEKELLDMFKRILGE